MTTSESNMSAKERKVESSGTPELKKCLNTADKFRAYRLGTESKERKLKEAEVLIRQLKDEINFSKNVEKNLRSQMSSAQDRLICQEKMLKKFLNVSSQQRRNEELSTQIEKRVEELRERINKTLEESQNIFSYASKEVNLLGKIKELESALKTKESECDFKKMEIQTLTKEMKTLETEFQQKLNNLENELDRSKKKEAETLTLYREALVFYKQQIEDYERKMELYEKERKSFLEDFEPPKESKAISENFTLADSTVDTNSEDRSPSCKIRCNNRMEMKSSNIQIFQCSSPAPRSNFKKGKAQSFQKASTRQRPQLEFLTASQDSCRAGNSVEFRRKRRLFSTNRNHYA